MTGRHEPGWKRNGRGGPLDWWLGCGTHGDKWACGCMSCALATDHNEEFRVKLEREKASHRPGCAAVSTMGS